MNFQFFDLDNAVNTIFKKEDSLLEERSQNLREDYPEVFLECESCLYQKMDLSNLTAHVFPSQSRYTIDYMRFNDGMNLLISLVYGISVELILSLIVK